LNINLTQLRSSASLLNYDLFRVGIVADPSCRCDAALENLKHFLLDCPIYLQARTTLIDNLNMVTTCYTLDIKGVGMIRAEIGLNNGQIINETYSFRCFLIL